jgi:hypothetical protein
VDVFAARFRAWNAPAADACRRAQFLPVRLGDQATRHRSRAAPARTPCGPKNFGLPTHRASRCLYAGHLVGEAVLVNAVAETDQLVDIAHQVKRAKPAALQ